MIFLIAMQSEPLPDIALHATVEARSVTIEQRGKAEVAVTATPDGGSRVKIAAPTANGAKTLRNVRITVDAEAKIDPVATPAATGSADQR